MLSFFGKITRFFCYLTLFSTYGVVVSSTGLWEYIYQDFNVQYGFDFNGVYSGEFSPQNYPGSRSAFVSIAYGQSLVIFGGTGYPETGEPFPMALQTDFSLASWRFLNNTPSLQKTLAFNGKYSPSGVFSQDNYPSSRFSACGAQAWESFFLFGGYGRTESAGPARVGELFEYSFLEGIQGEWRHHPNSHTDYNQNGLLYSTSFDPGNRPGTRMVSAMVANGDSLFLFGGDGSTKTSPPAVYMELADFWEYGLVVNEWRFHHIDDMQMEVTNGVYATDYSPTSFPGSRKSHSMVSFRDSIFLWGGLGFSESGTGTLGDLWQYNISKQQWRFIAQDEVVQKGNAFPAIYGSSFSPDNYPGARFAHSLAILRNSLWLFGGNTNTDPSFLHGDMWELELGNFLWKHHNNTVSTQTGDNFKGSYSERLSTSSFPGARESSTLVSFDNALWLWGGSGYSSEILSCGDSGYLGDMWKYHTQLSECLGIPFYEQSVCSSHGSCVSNECLCDSGYDALNDCSLWECYGILSNESDVTCSNHGRCLDYETCLCDSNWDISPDCSITMCYDDRSNSTSTCSSHGSCIAPNVCQCWGNYAPPICEVCKYGFADNNDNCTSFHCFGKSPSDNDVCSGHGDCIGKDNCRCWGNYEVSTNCLHCKSGFTDDQNDNNNCTTPTCWGLAPSDPLVCNGDVVNGPHGECFGVDNCICFGNFDAKTKCATCILGWADENNNCSTPSCLGLAPSDPDVCGSGGGLCVNKDVCQCFGNLDPATYCATCLPGYGEPEKNCTTPTCWGLVPSDPLVCNGDAVDGPHGECFGVDNCICYGNYDTKTKCATCVPGWADENNNCSTPSCLGLSPSDPNVCNSGGLCVNRDVCQCFGNLDSSTYCASCQQGYAEPDKNCTTPTCWGLVPSDPLVCNGDLVNGAHGECFGVDNCICYGNYDTKTKCATCVPGWADENNNCSTPSCLTLAPSDPNVCNAGGQCINKDVCKCYGNLDPSTFCATCLKGYAEPDSNCTVPTCFGVSASSSSDVCNGNGVCRLRDSCECFGNFDPRTACKECFYGYFDDNNTCSTPLCHNLHPSDHLVCHGNGRCVGRDFCLCYGNFNPLSGCKDCVDGWKDDNNNCTSTSCFGISSSNKTHVCGGEARGRCVARDVCVCKENSNYDVSTQCGKCKDKYFDNNDGCNTHSCFGISEKNKKTCNSHGKCKSMDFCSCQKGYSGNECSNFDSFSVYWPGYIFGSFGGVCVALSIAVIVVSIFVFAVKQTKKLKRFDKIEDIELILEEQSLEANNSTASFNVSKEYMTIPMKSLKILKEIGRGGSGTVILLVEFEGKFAAFKRFGFGIDGQALNIEEC